MHDEYNALIQQGTWTLVFLPPTKKLLVANGCFVSRKILMVPLLGIKPEKEVYMHQPIGFVDNTHPSMVCKINKALYGLKQAPRAWFSTFSSFLLIQGFKANHCDSSLFVKKTCHFITILLMYVDDILVTGNDSYYIFTLITQMHSTFFMKELGLLKYFLGISVTSSFSSYFLSQKKYATEMLVKASMTNCKSSPSPMTFKSSIDQEDFPFSHPSLYRSLIGALQYLTITRPDLAFVVNHACQFLQTPFTSHFALVKRLLRYLKGTLHLGLQFSPDLLTLHAFSDSDWAGCSLDRRSTTGYCVFLGPNLISWSAKKQPTVSRSFIEAGYRALAQTATELSWIGMLLSDLSISVSAPTLWCDNMSAISLSNNPMFHARSKHIEVDYHMFRKGCSQEVEYSSHLICGSAG
ncbi:uncharacterized protein LOC114295243 [Camellia sinensis]|uniref:uncharacterized protein LOC114295243 n=1 Tax=Camellia sinensis TaxID=4442 RepID=UPI00103565BE|nr:uncharacterized protein LOC114295243 [Camellia sinensis]